MSKTQSDSTEATVRQYGGYPGTVRRLRSGESSAGEAEAVRSPSGRPSPGRRRVGASLADFCARNRGGEESRAKIGFPPGARGDDGAREAVTRRWLETDAGAYRDRKVRRVRHGTAHFRARTAHFPFFFNGSRIPRLFVPIGRLGQIGLCK